MRETYRAPVDAPVCAHQEYEGRFEIKESTETQDVVTVRVWCRGCLTPLHWITCAPDWTWSDSEARLYAAPLTVSAPRPAATEMRAAGAAELPGLEG